MLVQDFSEISEGVTASYEELNNMDEHTKSTEIEKWIRTMDKPVAMKEDDKRRRNKPRRAKKLKK